MDRKLKMKCNNCEGENFEAQDGLYFCAECHIQFKNFVEMEYNDKFEENKRIRRVRFIKEKVDNVKGKFIILLTNSLNL